MRGQRHGSRSRAGSEDICAPGLPQSPRTGDHADDYAALAADDASRLADLLCAVRDLLGAEYVPTADDRQSIASPTTLARSWKKSPARRFRSGPPRTPSTPAGIQGGARLDGSWYEADVAVDPLGGEVADQDLIAELGATSSLSAGSGTICASMAPACRSISLEVCVLPHFLRGDVEARLLDAFSDRLLADGGRGFFHPDNLTFGAGLFMSRMVAAAQAVAGVMEVQAVRLARYRFGSPAADGTLLELPAGGVLRLSPFEIAQLDSDPNFPENGRLTLLMRGGR